MTTFNTLVSTVKAMVLPTAKAPAAAKPEAAPQVKMAGDSLKLGKRPAEDGYAALQRAQILMADRLGDLGMALDASQAQEANADGFEAQLAIQARRGGLLRDNEKLTALGRLTGRLAANSTASDADRTKLAGLVREACSPAGVSSERLNQLLVEAEDTVRNAGRKVPTDRGLANATKQLATRIGELEATIGHLEAELSSDHSTEELQKIQMKLADLHQDRDLLQGVKAQADRLANRRGATDADAKAMAGLLHHAAHADLSHEGRRGLLTEAEFVARNAGGPAGDRGVHEATAALARRVGAVEAQMADLTEQAQGDVSSEELQKIQIKLSDLGRDRDTLLTIKGQADRVMNRRDDLDAGDRETLVHHLNEANTDVSPTELYLLLGDLQFIGR